jgi:uncharacterized protein (TIGR02145 family)
MSFCAKCGTQIQEESKFCKKCGAAIAEHASSNAARKKPNIRLIAAGVAVIVLAIIGFIIFQISENSVETTSKEIPLPRGKLSDGGIIWTGSDGGSFMDIRDNSIYKVIRIGEQVWMAENLNYDASGSKCYDNNQANCDKYGRLYDWKTANTACPSGWHLPSDEEWDMLYRFADGTNGTTNPYESSIAGKHLKAASGWNNNGNGIDTHGFAALPGGNSDSKGTFNGIDDYGYWWSASESSANNANRRSLLKNDDIGYWRSGPKSWSFSVRCLQDTESSGDATAELEREAKKWQKNTSSYKNTEGEFFSFKKMERSFSETGAVERVWTATSKIKIGDCPAKSVWEMMLWAEEGMGIGNNKVPPKCKSITPKAIIGHKFEEEDR